MQLQEWLKKQPYGTKARMARDCGLGFNTLCYLARRVRAASYRSAVLISRFTDGAVTVDELMNPRGRVVKPKRRKKKASRRPSSAPASAPDEAA